MPVHFALVDELLQLALDRSKSLLKPDRSRLAGRKLLLEHQYPLLGA